MSVPAQVAEVLYGRNVYVKKIIEEANTVDETAKLLKVMMCDVTRVMSLSSKSTISCLRNIIYV